METNTVINQPKKGFYVIIWFFILSFILYFIVFAIFINKRKAYFMIMIDPNHGGKQAVASAADGDRYDLLSGTYKRNYDAGYTAADINEFGLLLKISKKIQEKLDLTQGMFKWKKFEGILKKYGIREKYPRVIFDTVLVKEHDYTYYEKKRDKDVNRHFRLFNFGSNGFLRSEKKGILSALNKVRPHLILHLDFNYRSTDDRALFSINLPGYAFFNSVKSNLILRDINFNSENRRIINSWYGKDQKDKMQNMMNDIWTYFTGYLPDQTFFQASGHFTGIGYNMVTWPLRDNKYQENYIRPEHNPQYQKDLKNFIARGAFWEREGQAEEIWKRQDGDHIQPDALYASEEVLKYLKYMIEKTGNNEVRKIDPVYSVEDISLYTYTLVININLGSILDPELKALYEKNTDKIAEALCLGLYSICAGYELKELPDSDIPSGKPLDFKKYKKNKYFGVIRKKFY